METNAAKRAAHVMGGKSSLSVGTRGIGMPSPGAAAEIASSATSVAVSNPSPCSRRQRSQQQLQRVSSGGSHRGSALNGRSERKSVSSKTQIRRVKIFLSSFVCLRLTKSTPTGYIFQGESTTREIHGQSRFMKPILTSSSGLITPATVIARAASQPVRAPAVMGRAAAAAAAALHRRTASASMLGSPGPPRPASLAVPLSCWASPR